MCWGRGSNGADAHQHRNEPAVGAEPAVSAHSPGADVSAEQRILIGFHAILATVLTHTHVASPAGAGVARGGAVFSA